MLMIAAPSDEGMEFAVSHLVMLGDDALNRFESMHSMTEHVALGCPAVQQQPLMRSAKTCAC